MPPWLIPGAPGWQVTRSPGGLGQTVQLVYLPPLALPLTARLRAARTEKPRLPLPGFRSVPIPLHCLLARWMEGWSLGYSQTSFQSHFTLLHCSLLLLWGFLTASPRKFHTPPPQCKASVWSLLGLAKNGGWGVLLLSQSPPFFLWHRERSS